MTDLKSHYEKVFNCMEKLEGALVNGNIDDQSKDGTLAADLHAFYNEVGAKEGWLKEELATPLSKQPEVIKRKKYRGCTRCD